VLITLPLGLAPLQLIPLFLISNLSTISDNPKVETTLEPLALLDELQDIENSMGRKKVIEKGPRNIDLDILLYEDYIIKHERLGVPHIGIAEREFVLRPLAEYIYFPSQAWLIPY
jgi:2-amino-4-hydroxy-6-hydroxymethyldihydropteridine diphosphokinase/dihydropteroate synthase